MILQALRMARRPAARCRALLLALAVAVPLLLAACSNGEPEPPAEPEQQAAMEEPAAEGEQQKAQAGQPEEGQPPAEGEETAMQAPGEEGESMMPAPEPTPPEPPEEMRWEEAFPEEPAGPPMVRIAVLAPPDRLDQGRRVAVLLNKYQNKRLEQELGKKVNVVYVSASNDSPGGRSLIRYRQDHLKAAIRVAAAMPQEQLVEPMSAEEEGQVGVDLIIYVGRAVR